MKQFGFALAEAGDALDLDIYSIIGESFWFDAVSAKAVLRRLQGTQSKTKTINVNVHSDGGDIFDASDIFFQLAEHPAKKIVRIGGLAASAASFVAMVGDEIIMGPAAWMMIHHPWGGAEGSAEKLIGWGETLLKARDTYASIYAARSKQPKDKVLEMMAAETWLTAEEAVKLGFADRIENAITAPADAKAKARAQRAFAAASLNDFSNVPEAVRKLMQTARGELEQERPPAPAPQPVPAPVATPPKERPAMKFIALLTAMGLSAEASDEAAMSAFNALKPLADGGRRILALTGKDNVDAAIGTIDAWKEQAGKVPELERQVGESKANADKSDLDALIRKGQEEKKLTPDQAGKLRAKVEACFKARAEMKATGKSRDLTDDEWTLGQAKAYVEALPVNGALAANSGTPPAPPAPGAGSGGSSGNAESMKHNGKAYEDMSGPERVKLHDTDKASFDMVRNDWIARGEPAAAKKSAA